MYCKSVTYASKLTTGYVIQLVPQFIFQLTTKSKAQDYK